MEWYGMDWRRGVRDGTDDVSCGVDNQAVKSLALVDTERISTGCFRQGGNTKKEGLTHYLQRILVKFEFYSGIKTCWSRNHIIVDHFEDAFHNISELGNI